MIRLGMFHSSLMQATAHIASWIHIWLVTRSYEDPAPLLANFHFNETSRNTHKLNAQFFRFSGMQVRMGVLQRTSC